MAEKQEVYSPVESSKALHEAYHGKLAERIATLEDDTPANEVYYIGKAMEATTHFHPRGNLSERMENGDLWGEKGEFGDWFGGGYNNRYGNNDWSRYGNDLSRLPDNILQSFLGSAGNASQLATEINNQYSNNDLMRRIFSNPNNAALKAMYGNTGLMRNILGSDVLLHMTPGGDVRNTLTGSGIAQPNGTVSLSTKNGKPSWRLQSNRYFNLGNMNALQGSSDHAFTAYIVVSVEAGGWQAMLCNTGTSSYEQMHINGGNFYKANNGSWSSYPSQIQGQGQLGIVKVRMEPWTHHISVNGGSEHNQGAGSNHTLFSGHNIYFGHSNQIGYYSQSHLCELIIVRDNSPEKDSLIMAMLKAKFNL